MKALIDADSLLYKVCFAIEEKIYWNEFDVLGGSDELPDITYDTDLTQCYRTFDQMVENIMFATDTEGCLLVFSGGINFRLSFPTEYKTNRAGSRKPTGYTELLTYARNHYNHVVTDGIEADDLVVYMRTNSDDEWVLCAIDKDILYQTVGTHYNYGRDEEVTVNEFEALWFAYYQTLAGDQSDGYKGCKGIGDKKARKILDGLETETSMWSAVLQAYEKAGQTPDEALWTMRLANMHQYDGEKIVLWEPPF